VKLQNYIAEAIPASQGLLDCCENLFPLEFRLAFYGENCWTRKGSLLWIN